MTAAILHACLCPRPPARRPDRIEWRLILSGWLIVSLAGSTVRYTLLSDDFLLFFATQAARVLVGVALTALVWPVLIFVIETSTHFWRCMRSLGAIIAVVAALDSALLLAFDYLLLGAEVLTPVYAKAVTVYRIALHVSWVLLFYQIRVGMIAHSRAEQAALEEERARMDLLRAQLNPHLLFNALSGLCGTIREDPDAAIAASRQLAAFYRETMRQIDSTRPLTLADEWRLITAYLQVEQSRFGARLSVKTRLDPSIHDFPIPPLLLMPLVENAVKFGAETGDDKIDVEVLAEAAAGLTGVVIRISNQGRWLRPETPRHAASGLVGLANLRDRLKRSFPKRHEFDVGPVNDRVVARLTLRRS